MAKDQDSGEKKSFRQDVNTVFISGNLVKDPESREYGEDGSLANFTVASNSVRKKGDELQEEATFVDVTVFGRTSQIVKEYFHKGSPILVEGRLRLDKWEDKESGSPRSKLVIIGNRIHFMDRGKRSGNKDAEDPSKDRVRREEKAPRAARRGENDEDEAPW